MSRFAIAWVCLVLSSSALAGNDPRADAASLVQTAKSLYDSGKYTESIVLLQKAYELNPEPAILFNIARALDQSNDVAQALDTYQKYLALKDGDASRVKKANLAVDRLTSALKKQQEAQKRQTELEREARLQKERAEAEAALAKKQRDEFDLRDKERVSAMSKGGGLGKAPSLITGGAAVAALGLSLGFGLAANGSRAAFDRSGDFAQKKALEGTTRTQALVSDLALVSAVALAVTSVILWPRYDPTSDLAMTWVPTASGGVLTLAGTWP